MSDAYDLLAGRCATAASTSTRPSARSPRS